MNNKSKLLTILLCFALIFSFTLGTSVFAKSSEENSHDISIIETNEEFLKLQTKISGVEGILTLDKETGEITVATTEKSKKTGENETIYTVDLEVANDEEIEGTIINEETDHTYHIDTDALSASIPLVVGVVISEVLLAHLVSIGLATVISGVTYLSYSEFAKKKKTYSHYMATIENKKLWMGNGLSLTKAASRLKSGQNTWSTSKTNAQAAAKKASPLSKAIGSEIDREGSGKYYHYHPVSHTDRLGLYVKQEGAHAFYGAPRN